MGMGMGIDGSMYTSAVMNLTMKITSPGGVKREREIKATYCRRRRGLRGNGHISVAR